MISCHYFWNFQMQKILCLFMVRWPSGLRRCIQVAVYPQAWVQIPLASNIFTSYLSPVRTKKCTQSPSKIYSIFNNPSRNHQNHNLCFGQIKAVREMFVYSFIDCTKQPSSLNRINSKCQWSKYICFGRNLFKKKTNKIYYIIFHLR